MPYAYTWRPDLGEPAWASGQERQWGLLLLPARRCAVACQAAAACLLIVAQPLVGARGMTAWGRHSHGTLATRRAGCAIGHGVPRRRAVYRWRQLEVRARGRGLLHLAGCQIQQPWPPVRAGLGGLLCDLITG